MLITPYLQNPYRKQSEEPEGWWTERRKEDNITYVWQVPLHERHDGIDYSFYRDVDYDDRPSDEINPKYPRFELIKIKLPLPPVDSAIEQRNLSFIPSYPLWDNYSSYFLDALGLSNWERAEKKLNYYFFWNIIIPKNIAEEIRLMIEEFNLTAYEDYIFFLIAKTQREFVRDIEYYQEKERQEKIKKFPAECANLVKVVEKNYESHRVFRDPTNKSGKTTWCYYDEENRKYIPHNKPSVLEKIVFHFDNEKPISVTDDLLLSNIMDGIVHLRDEIYFSWQTGKRREWLNTANYLRWKSHVLGLPELLYSQHKKNQFKDNVAEALQQFLTSEAKLKTTKSREVIARIFDFALIEVKKRPHSDLPADVETIRKRISRKKRKNR